ncbi:slipin family protein [Patescibacteria group bacterium]|nr:slipin family protein [Patescibacteria group bacterium]MBU1448950.1 slipin family protein [Patescibacteria group bacterium]MBU2613318.1 slipin family protein [Patescibacteria group bacterium]
MEYLYTLPWIVVAFIVFVRQVNQYERGVMFTFGKFTGLVNPGWRIVIPVFQSMKKVDIRTKAVEVPYQEAITRDNVSCKINAVIYYKVADAGKAVLEVENFWNAISQLAQTTMRNIVGELTLDELLSERDQASARIKELIAAHSTAWGIEVSAVELKDIQLPEDMVRTIAKQAEAERERRAVIINAEGEVIAAENLNKAAEILMRNPAALHLRTLNSINDISSDQSNTVVFAIPVEILRAFEAFAKRQ